MIKTSLIPQHGNVNITIPKKYIGKKIEVLLYAVEEISEQTENVKTMADFWNVISDESANKLHNNVSKLRDEWKRDI